MENELRKNGTSESLKTASIDEVLIRNILLLHFKRGMSSKSIGNIFSLPELIVEEKISNFAEQFSNKENLTHVINGLASMNNKKEKGAAEGPAADAKDREIADLKKKLTEAEIRAEVYLETIRLAETRFGIKIIKKSGAK